MASIASTHFIRRGRGSTAHCLTALLVLLPTLTSCDRGAGPEAAAPAVSAPAAEQAQTLTFRFPDSRYPILFSGTTVEASQPITSVRYFAPLFGKSRTVVNPAPIDIDGRQLTFREAGEYYLVVNDAHHLKAIVLDATEPISQGVTRIYDFNLANVAWCTADDRAWYEAADHFLEFFFYSPGPVGLLCGPAAEVFRRMVWDRFRLPSRVVTFPGTYYAGSEIRRATHNVPEVYLPDKRKFVLFDINNSRRGVMIKHPLTSGTNDPASDTNTAIGFKLPVFLLPSGLFRRLS